MTREQVWAVVAFCGGGLFFVCLGALLLIPVRAARRFRQSAMRATGTVVGYQQTQWDAEVGTRFDPVVTYRDQAGAEHTAVILGTSRKTLEPGQAVNVLFDPGSPGRAQIAGFDGRREQTWIAAGFVFMGCVTVLMGVAIWVCRIPVTRG